MAGHQQMLLGVSAAAPPPPGGLTIVQAPTTTMVYVSNNVQQTLTAVGSGNAVVIMLRSPTAEGAPTSISDSAGGSWGTVRQSFDEASGVTVRWYARANITDGITWVRADYATFINVSLKAVEVSGAGSAITLDASATAAQTSATLWEMPFTSTVNDVLLMSNFSLSNGTVPTGVSPLTSEGVDGNYATVSYGIFPVAGANTAQVNLADGRTGDKSWAVFRAGS